MSSQSPKSRASSAGSEEKSKDHPDDILPVFLTSATQELFACHADEDVTAENPYKLLRKDDIVQDMKTRAAVSDFSPAKQIVLDYPEDEILLVFDGDFMYGQNFYLVLTPEAKEGILNPPEKQLQPEMAEVSVPESKPWISLGSEQEIEEESESREKLRYKFSRVRRKFGAPVCFSDWNTADAKDGCMECASYQDSRFSIKQMERDCGTQAVPKLQSSSAQTQWTYQKNMYTQYKPREFSEEEKERILQSESLKNSISSVTPRLLRALQQNEIMDVFFDDWGSLGTGAEGAGFEGMANSSLKVYQAFTDLQYMKEKKISCVNWHPTINGVIAVAVTEKVSLEERFKGSTKFLLNPPLILFWSLSDPSNPQLLLECPDDVFAFEFCPSDPNIMVGGCMNGQVVLWDISAHLKRLQGTRPGAGKNIPINADTFDFEEKREKETPVVRYCAVSAIESSHKALITDVQWLPRTFEVTKTGVPVENKDHICVQLVTCSPDCSLMFWDVRAPMAAAQSATDQKQKVDPKPHVKPYGVPDTFRHLDRTWKPLFRVSLPMMDTSGEYSPLKFSLEDYTLGSSADATHLYADRSEVTPEYSQLRVPSGKTFKSLEDVNTKLYIGTEDGEVVYTDWKLEKDNDSGRLYSVKPFQCFSIHDWLVNTVQRSPFFKDIVLTVGGWNFAIWKEGVMHGPIMQSPCSEQLCNVGYWSPSRPAVFFIGKEDGNVEVWDLLEKTHEPSQVHSITTGEITCIKPWIVSSKQHFLAVSDDLGMLHILEIPWMLHSPSGNEKLSVGKYFEAEVDRLAYFAKRREIWAQQKRDTEAEELRKKTEVVVPVKDPEQIEEEGRNEYEENLKLEKAILKGMGLLPAADDTSDS